MRGPLQVVHRSRASLIVRVLTAASCSRHGRLGALRNTCIGPDEPCAHPGHAASALHHRDPEPLRRRVARRVPVYQHQYRPSRRPVHGRFQPGRGLRRRLGDRGYGLARRAGRRVHAESYELHVPPAARRDPDQPVHHLYDELRHRPGRRVLPGLPGGHQSPGPNRHASLPRAAKGSKAPRSASPGPAGT